MTMPHLMNCEHSSYGICKECSAKYAPPDGWFDAGLPPADCRRVIMCFDDGREREGFYWSHEKLWYKSDGSKKRHNAVRPVKWRERLKNEQPAAEDNA